MDVTALVVGSLSLGGLLALVGIGFSVIYRTTRIVNFAQGSFLALSAYVAVALTGISVLGQVGGLLATVVLMGLLGVLLYYVLIRRVLGGEEFAVVILTFGLSIVVLSAIGLIWGTSRRSLPLSIKSEVIEVGDIRVGLLELTAFIVAVVAVALVAGGMKYSKWGLRARAIAHSPALAANFGINTDRIAAVAWGLSLATAAMAGIVYGAMTGVELTLAHVGLIAFPAIILGGLESLPGALIGGLIVGTVITALTYWYGPDIANIAAYSLLMVVLVVMPQGLFGERAGRTV